MGPGDDRAIGLSLMRECVAVSRETEGRLDMFAALLRKWQKAKNLVSPHTMDHLWTRHFADSAQVLAISGDAKSWVDLGSGAGFPGLVVAVFAADSEGSEIHLVESNARKCAFLRTVARETAAPARVHPVRISDYVAGRESPVDVVTARALAPLRDLVCAAAPMIKRGAVGIFHKGQDVDSELTEASRYWKLDVELVPSRTHDRGYLVLVRDYAEKHG